jgi:putative ABC transport system permease protein
MNFIESLRVALSSLTSNKMRTSLTMLGIIIGVAVVILVVAIGRGATKSVTDSIDALGTNILTVTPGASRIRINAATVKGSTSVPNRLSLMDATLIARNFKKSILAVAPLVRGQVQIRLGSRDANTNLTGSTVDYPVVSNVELSAGRFFTLTETEGSQKVCVIGTTVAEKLTGDADTDMTGQFISINRQEFRVIGMLASKGSAGPGQDQDDSIVTPITTAMRRILNKQFLTAIAVRCIDAPTMLLAQEQVSSFLRNRHHLQPPFPDNDDFTIRSSTDLMARVQVIAGTLTTLLSAVAVISLLVGGIGIMNIMLVSVTERTREIGIRKAIGATPYDIRLQFLIESVILSLAGGIVGIFLGIGGAVAMAAVSGWSVIVSPASVLLALGVSMSIGIFFGLYPASKAAGLHPIDALHYE